MQKLLPGWVSYRQVRRKCRQKSRTHRAALSSRRLLFESLEERMVLAGGVIPTSVQDTLATNLTTIINNSLAPTASMPMVGAALANNPDFVKAQVQALLDDLDSASVTPGDVSVSPGATSVFTVNRLVSSHGELDVPFDLGLDFLPLDPPDPDNPDANTAKDMRVHVEVYFRLQFSVDTLTGTTTFVDAPISDLTPTLWTQGGGTLFNGGPLRVDAPDSPLAIVISAYSRADFEASGDLQGAFDATIYDVFWQKLNRNEPVSIEDRTWMTATIDVTMGPWSTSPSGNVGPNVSSRINGEAHANLELHLVMSDPMDFNLTARLDADWTFDNVLLTPTPPPLHEFGTLPYVDILDVTVELDSTLRVLGGILDTIQDITNNPAVGAYMAVMDTDLPIIEKSIFEIADALGAMEGGWGDAISTIKFINSLHVPGQGTGGTINLGAFRIADPRAGGPIQITQTQLGNGAPQAVNSFFDWAFGLDFPNEDYSHGLHFWFLEDPINVLFPVMMGEDRTLMTFTMPELDFRFDLDDVYGVFGTFDLFPAYPGVSLGGEFRIRLDVDLGYDTEGLRRRERNQSPDKDDAKYGFYINTDETFFQISTGMTLSAGGLGFEVEGGIYGGVEVIPVGYLDPDDPNRVRGGHLLRDAWKMVQAYGDIYAHAHFDYPGGSETLVDHETILDFDFFGFDTEVHPVPANHEITITKTNTSEKIFVLDQRIDPSTGRPVYGTPNVYDHVIAVLTDDVTDYYRIGKYVKQEDGSYSETLYTTAQRIVVVGPTAGANHKDIHKTIVIDDVFGGSGPVDAVILGGNGIDTLLYYGSGSAVIVGGRGNDTIRALPLTGSGGPSVIVTDYADAAHPIPNLLGLPQGRMDEINWAATPPPPAGPPGEDDDPAPTDPGRNKVVASTNATVIDLKLPDAPPPGGGGGSEGGSGGDAPMSFIELVSASPIGAGGYIVGSDYRLFLKAALGTPISTGNMALSAVSTANGMGLRAVGTEVNLTAVGVSQFFVHSFGGDLHIGDLTTLPELHIIVASQPRSAGTSTVMDGPSSGASNLEISHDENVFGHLFVTGALAYASVQFVGLSYRDRLRVKHAGGTVSVSDLTGAGLGNLTIDNSGRPGGSTTAANITVNNHASSLWVVPDTNPNNVLFVAVSQPNLLIVDHRAIDNLNLNLTGTSEHRAYIDASTMKGDFNIVTTGAATAKNDITLAKVGTTVNMSVDGGVANTTLHFGRNRLSDIRHDVTASNLQLRVDNFGATDARSMTFTPTTFTGWDAGGLSPTLHYNNLRGVLTVDAGGDDRYNLAGSPVGIASSDFNSFTDVRSSIYATSWQSMLRIDGDWQAFFGQRIHTNGTVERVKLLNDLSNLFVMFNYDSDSAVPTQFVIDGDLHAPGAVYGIGSTRLVTGAAAALSVALQDELASGARIYVENQTIGLQTAFFGLTHPDDIFIYLPGGTVNANLTATPQGSIHIDGRARLAGTNPNAPNVINVLARAGSVSMTSLDTYDSLLTAYNPVHIYGSMPQDDLNVTQPTEFKMASTAIGANQTRFDFALNGANGFTLDPPASHYTVHRLDAMLPNNPLNPNPTDVTPVSIWPITSQADNAIMTQDLTRSPLEAVIVPIGGNYIMWSFNVDGVNITIPVEVVVTVQVYPQNSNPIATENHVNIDASQLRGTFDYLVTEPAYAYAQQLIDGLARFNGQPLTNYARTYVTISKTHAELETTITGTIPVSSQHHFLMHGHASASSTVDRWPGTQVTVGTGVLANLQGDITVNQVWLKEVDNRNAAQPNIIALSAAGVSWQSPVNGRTSLTLQNLQGKMTVTGSPHDRFAVEGTPNSAYRTVIRNFSAAATPSGVYVMGKNVMPLEVSGNFDLTVGRRLNLDGTVTNVGTVLGAMDDTKTYSQTGGTILLGGISAGLWLDFQVLPATGTSIAGPITWGNTGYLSGFNARPPLPIYYDYSGPGQGTLVFDASNDTVTDRQLGDMIVQVGGSSLNGISSNSNYAGKANLRFYESDIIYGPNTNVYWYGAKLRTTTNAFDVMAPTLFNNLLNGEIHYFANPANIDERPIEQILIGRVLSPVFVEGSGRNTRVEINPLFSLPTSLAMSIFDSSISAIFGNYSHPGWGGGHTGGHSLIDTVEADVSVSHAALRVIADIPLLDGTIPLISRPNVTIGSSTMTGIATGTIHYANLIDSILPGTSFFNSSLDLNRTRFPGLNVQLPTHYPVETTVQDTHAGATTHIATRLSSSPSTFTNGAVNVLKTTGSLVLGELFGNPTTLTERFTWPGLGGSIFMQWADGISVPQINIGNNGSLADIQGKIFLRGDSRLTSATEVNIDGRNDAARPNVSFTQTPDVENPFPTGSFVLNTQVDGLTPATIYFGPNYRAPNPLNIYGSAGSTYDVAYGPVDMKLYAGVGSTTTLRRTPLSVIGGSTVTMLMPTSSPVPNYTGTPEFYVEQDPANPAPINIIVERATTLSGANFRLESTGNGMMRLVDGTTTVWWRMNYKGSDAAISINYGNITVADTGSLGTTVSSKAAQVSVHGTTGLLQILPVGTATGNAPITLGNGGNMQAILGNVEVTPGLPAAGATFDNRNDTSYRHINMSHIDGVLTVTGLAPGIITFTGTHSALIYGGSGGSEFALANTPTFTSVLTLIGGSSPNDTVVGPNFDSLFNITNSNAGQLNSKASFSNVENLRGGSGNDTFQFISNGQLSGGIDGGLGTDTVSYSNPNWWRLVPYDLSIGVLPRAGGFSTSIERAPFDVINPGNRTNIIGQAITPVPMTKHGGPLSVTWTASNLPAGLSIDPQTGVISGTITLQSTGNRTVQVFANDGTYSSNVSFLWTLQEGLLGDFNQDNATNAADYVLWRKVDGSSAGYNTWKTHFGEIATSGGAGSEFSDSMISISADESTSLSFVAPAVAARQPAPLSNHAIPATWFDEALGQLSAEHSPQVTLSRITRQQSQVDKLPFISDLPTAGRADRISAAMLEPKMQSTKNAVNADDETDVDVVDDVFAQLAGV